MTVGPHHWRKIHRITPEDRINASLRGISVEQYISDQIIEPLKGTSKGFRMLSKPIKLSRMKCWFWTLLPGFVLGDDPIHFRTWDIGKCLNCDADPYDGSVLAWDYDSRWYRGALIKCNKCGCLRWQQGESGMDY